MSFSPSTRAVVLVAVLAIVLPVLARVLASPLTLLILSPLLLFVLALAYLASVVYAAWFLDLNPSPSDDDLRRAARPFAFSTPAAWQVVLTRSQWSQNVPKTLPALYPESPDVSDALNDILKLIIRDFVSSWYNDLSTSPAFPIAVTAVIHASLQQLFDRATSIDASSLIVKRILPKVTAHIEQFRQSEVALRGAGLERRLTQSEELDLLLASRYASKGVKLHPAVENLSTTFTKQTEEMHLRHLVDKALPFILPAKERKSKAIRLVVREILTCTVIFPIVEMIADPDFWNKTIDQVAGAAIHQQQLISKVRNLLEAQIPRNPSKTTAPTSTHIAYTERITIRTSSKQFESFLKSIGHCSSLLDARRLKNDITGEIRRTRLLLANHDKDDWIDGEKTEDVVAFLDRLYTAKRKVEERISVLGGEQNSQRQTTYQEPSPKPGISLRDILRNPNPLSYFMEFMDRRHRSLPVQFWLTVESFKNPLESIDSDTSGEDEEIIQDPSTSVSLKEDISMIYELYFADGRTSPALSVISKKYIDTIRDFVAETDPPTAVQRKVRRSVLHAQRQVEREMEQDFEDFERSELWFRVVGDAAFTNSKQSYISNASSMILTGGDLLFGVETPTKASSPTISVNRPKYPLAVSPTHALPPPNWGASSAAHTSANASSMQRSISSTSNRSAQSKVSGHTPSNIEVLMSPVLEGSPGEPRRAPLFDNDPEDEMQRAEEKRMEAIHAALTDIMALEEEGGKPKPMAQKPKSKSSSLFSKRQGSKIYEDEDEDSSPLEGDDGDASGEGEVGRVSPDEHDHDPDPPTSTFHLAAPGDLQLKYEINRLGAKIANLEAQEAMLETLIKKAELTGDRQELRLLGKSKESLAKEIREVRFQREQYVMQEKENRLISERTKVAILNSVVGEEREGSGTAVGGVTGSGAGSSGTGGSKKSVVRYLVEVQQLGLDGNFSSGWVVARRYNEFFTMHNKLKERYLAVRNLDFPGKRLLVANLSESFLDQRRVALEKYLQGLVAIPVVCESEELRTFLSRDSPFMASAEAQEPSSSSSKGGQTNSGFSGSNLVRNVYRSVAESIDDMFFGPSMLDVMIQRLTRQAAEFAGIVGSGVHDEELVVQALNASSSTKGGGGPQSEEATVAATLGKWATGDLKPLDGETSVSTFSGPICDLVLAVFELDKKHNWLRRQAIVIILQQVLGGTIERKIRDNLKALLSPTKLLSYLDLFRDNLWPGGKLKPPGVPRTVEEKLRTRDEDNRKLSSLVPDLAANMIGRSNARRGARRIFAVLQNRRLNQHIVYTILDEVFDALFPETNTDSSAST